jgi:hypothetical protein
VEALLLELGVKQDSSTVLLCDNIGAMYLSSNLVFQACTKHIMIDYHLVHEILETSSHSFYLIEGLASIYLHKTVASSLGV